MRLPCSCTVAGSLAGKGRENSPEPPKIFITEHSQYLYSIYAVFKFHLKEQRLNFILLQDKGFQGDQVIQYIPR